MSKKLNILSILFVTLFVSSSLVVSVGIMSVPQSALSLEDQGSATAGYPATDLDNRNSPVSILVYTEFADTTTAAPYNEFRNTMDSIKATYGEQFRYDNLTSYSELTTSLPEYDILLLPEQETLNEENLTSIASDWTGPLASFVSNGGIVVALDAYGGAMSVPTIQILNETGLMSVYDPVYGAGWVNYRVNSSDALARGIEGSWPAPEGSVHFDTTDATIVVDDGTHAVVTHKIIGAGHVILLGFDLYERESNSDILLANAIRLHRHVVFDDSHSSGWTIQGNFAPLAQYFAVNGFAVSSMGDFSEDYLAACDILVLALCYVPYNAGDIAIIDNFVENGGGLFVCSDWGSWGSETDDLIQHFGYVRYDPGMALNDTDDAILPFYLPYDGENIHNHSITVRVNRVEIWAGSGFHQIPDDANVLIKTDGDGTADVDNLPIAIASTHGDGRIVVFGDSNALTDHDSDSDGTDNWEDSDNAEFFLNTIRWLSAAGIEEKTVLFDASHGYNFFVTASYWGFANLLTENGYTVFWMSTFYQALVEECDVFVVEDGSIEYNVTEIDFIENYVVDGGKLFLIGGRDIYGNETDPIGNRFGLDLNNTGYLIDTDDNITLDYYIVYESSNFGTHPIMQGITRFEAHFGTAFESIGTATALVTTDNDDTCQWAAGGLANALPMMVAKEHNKGRVVYSADYWFPRYNQDGDADGTSNLYDADNPLLLLNIFHWLVEDRAPTVEVIFPNGGEVLNGTETVTWDASDWDDDTMTYDVYFSDTSGSSWFVLEMGLTVMEYELNTSLYGDTSTNMVRIVVHANELSSEDQSDNPFEIDNLPDITYPPPDDLTVLVLIIAGVVVVIIIVIIMKKKK